MLHACVQRFDVTENLEKFCKILGTKLALGTSCWIMHVNFISDLNYRGCYLRWNLDARGYRA